MRIALGRLALMLMLAVAPGADAAFSLGSALPHSGVRLTAIDNGEVGMSLFEAGDPTVAQILGEYGGAASYDVSTGSTLAFRVDGTTYTTGGFHGTERVLPAQTKLNGTMATQEWILGDLRILVNVTHTHNAVRFHLRVSNEGVVAHDFAHRQTWDLYLNGVSDGLNSAPFLHIGGQPGEAGQPAGVHRAVEARWRPPSFGSIDVRRDAAGTAGGAQAHIAWDSHLGGTPPEEVVLASVKAYQQAWDYSVDPPPYPPGFGPGDNGALLLYWGKTVPIRLDPGEVHHLVHWYGRGAPSTYNVHRVGAEFTRLDPEFPDSTQRVRVVDAGRTVEEPFAIRHDGTLGPTTPRSETLRLELRTLALPVGWSARLLGPTGEDPAPASVTLPTGGSYSGRLRISVPPGAAGDDAARLEVRASLAQTPAGIDMTRDRTTASLQATVAVLPRLSVGLHVDDDSIKTAAPGGSVAFNLSVANLGNLRDPLPVVLEAGPLLPAGWSASFVPTSRVDIPRGSTVPAQLRVEIPPDEFAGQRDITLRARVAGRADANATHVRVRVVGPAELEAVPDASERLVPPGGARAFRVEFRNRGLDPVGFEARIEPPAGHAWTIQSVAPTVPTDGLQPGGRVAMLLTLRAPVAARAGERLEVPVVAIDPTTRMAIANATVVGIVDAAPSLGVFPDLADLPIDGTADLELEVRNLGNAHDNVTFEATKAPRGLLLSVEPRPLTLAPGATGAVRVRFQLPAGAPAGDHDVVLRPKSGVNASTPTPEVAVRLTVPERRDLALDLERTSFAARPGQRLELRGSVQNRGNVPTSYTVTGAPPGWTLRTLDAADGPIEPNTTRRIELVLLVAGDAPLGSRTIDLRAVPTAGAVGGSPARTLTIRLELADLRLDTLTPRTSDLFAGEPVSISVGLSNAGNGQAEGILVRFWVDGVEAETPVPIARLPPGRTASAVFVWVPTPGPHELRASVETKDPGGDAQPGDNERTMNVLAAEGGLSLKGGGAAPSPLGATIAALGIALTAWRRRA